jgi:hypothetical protein
VTAHDAPLALAPSSSTSPLDDFVRAAEAAQLRTELHYLGRGDTFRFTDL